MGRILRVNPATIEDEELRLRACGFCQQDLSPDLFEIFERDWQPPTAHDFCFPCRENIDGKIKKNPLYKPDLKKWAHLRLMGVLGGAKSRRIPVAITESDLLALYIDQCGKCALTGRQMSMRRKPHDWHKSNDQPMWGLQRKGGVQVVPKDGIFRRSNPLAPSVDRIDSGKGYTLMNIHLVINVVNIMKSDLTLDDFVAICKEVAHSQRGRENELSRAIGWI